MPTTQAPKIFSCLIVLSGEEPEFKNIGKGRTNFVHWGKRFLFYVPRLLFINITPGRLAKLQPQIKPVNPEPFKLAIEGNRSAAKNLGHWDGGKAALFLLQLMSGQDVTNETFSKIDEKPDKPLHGYSKVAAPEPPATPAQAAADDAGHLAKINEVNAALGAPYVSNRKTKSPTKVEVAEMKKAKKAKVAKKAANGTARGGGKYKEHHIVIKADGNPRREGTKAGDRFKAMKAYVGRHPKATVAEVIKSTTYRSNDLNFDIAAKNIEVKK